MTPFPDPRTILRRHNLSAKKSWGQNFLVSDRVYRAIVDATVRDDADWVVEFGAGLGTLTMRLSERVPEGKVVAVERDPDLVEVLKQELGHFDNVDVTPADAQHFDLHAIARWAGEPITVCGNLPYNIGTRLLMRTAQATEILRRAVFMVQKEVADRLIAQPGTKQYGALTLYVQRLVEVSPVVNAPPTAFSPAPKVESRVVLLVPYVDGPKVAVDCAKTYEDVVRAAFAQRRKNLRNTLRAVYPGEVVDSVLAETGLDGQRRGETLEMAEFAALANAVRQHA